MIKNKGSALILGGHVNGLSIANELAEDKSINVLLMDYGHSIAKFSNKVQYVGKIDNNSSNLLIKIMELSELYGYLVIFPTDDSQLELLAEIYDRIKEFCYVPFNNNFIKKALDKNFQYDICSKVNIPYPKSVHLNNVEQLNSEIELTFPLLIKPSKRDDLKIDVFRNKYLNDLRAFNDSKKIFENFLLQGVEFILSEFIPGNDTNIYAYTCVQDKNSNIKNEWIGKKLTQYPNVYGVFCSASNEAPLIVLEQGRQLVTAMKNIGISEPEFKFDHRDGQYKLMEVNLRSMMWHRVGSESEVKLHLSQYYIATGKAVPSYTQDLKNKKKLVLMLHEIPNLISRKGYFKFFSQNVFGSGERCWAIYNPNDIKPFFVSIPLLLKMMVSACLRRLNLR